MDVLYHDHHVFQSYKSPFQDSTVGTFHTKGWTIFFSGQIYTFWGQNNVFYDSAGLQVIF
jgi:hypothetical protein